MPDLAQDLLRYVLMGVGALFTCIIGVIVIDCLARIFTGTGLLP